jgi:hypothetical protein
MKKIIVNLKEFTKIKNNLEKSNKAWDPFITGIETCLLKEDWPRIFAIEKPVIKSLETIRRILDPVEKSR